jgi:hypothetical protein
VGGRALLSEKTWVPLDKSVTKIVLAVHVSATRQDVKSQRNYTFAFMQDAGATPEIKARKGGKAKKNSNAKAEVPAPQQVTTLDRVHAAMLLQAGGQTNGLRGAAARP